MCKKRDEWLLIVRPAWLQVMQPPSRLMRLFRLSAKENLKWWLCLSITLSPIPSDPEKWYGINLADAK